MTSIEISRDFAQEERDEAEARAKVAPALLAAQTDQWDEKLRGKKMSDATGRVIFKYQMPVLEKFTMKLPVGTNNVDIKTWYDSETKKSLSDITKVMARLVPADRQLVEFGIEEVMWRMEDKPYQKVRTILDIIQVGDFVKAKSRVGDWRKVISIDERGSIFGQGYSQPIDEPKYAKLTSSDNSMVHITQVVRNGVKLYGK